MGKREEKESYRKSIIEMVKNIDSLQLLKRIYNLVEYLYIYK